MPVEGRILSFKPHRGPTTLRGFLDLAIPARNQELRGVQEFRGVMVHEKNGSRWLAFPGVPQRDKDGNPLLRANGKPLYKSVFVWTGDEWNDIQARVIGALVRRYPEAFDTLTDGEQHDRLPA